MAKTNTKLADLETKNLAVEIKAEGEGVITAYAAAFGNTDSYGDVIQKGAFTKTVAERKDKVKVLYLNGPGLSIPPLTANYAVEWGSSAQTRLDKRRPAKRRVFHWR